MLATMAKANVLQGIPLMHIAIGLSVILLIIAFPAFFNPKKFRQAVEEFYSLNNATIRLASFVYFFLAFLIFNTNKFAIKFTTWRSVMTVIAYIAVLHGLAFLWFPEFTKRTGLKFFKTETGVYVIGIITFLVALGIGYLGLWVY